MPPRICASVSIITHSNVLCWTAVGRAASAINFARYVLIAGSLHSGRTTSRGTEKLVLFFVAVSGCSELPIKSFGRRMIRYPWMAGVDRFTRGHSSFQSPAVHQNWTSGAVRRLRNHIWSRRCSDLGSWLIVRRGFFKFD